MTKQDEAQPLSWEQRLFTIILHAGNARSKAIEAAELAENGKASEARAALEEAETEQLEAHKMEAEIIRSWAEIDHTRQLIRLYQRLEALENNQAE